MLRWLFLGLLLFGFTSGLRDGWLIVKWSQLFYQVGFTAVDPEKPLNWKDLMLNNAERSNKSNQ